MRALLIWLCCCVFLSYAASPLLAQHDDHYDGHDGYSSGTRRIEYHFGEQRHTLQLANKLWNGANSICWEAYNHYRHEHHWRETYAEMRKVLEDTKHIRKLVRENYHRSQHDEDHIANDLHDMDKLFHHLEEDIARWRPSFSDHGPEHGDPNSSHHGERHDGHRDYYNHLGGLKVRMALLEETLHHMMKDYGVKSKFQGDGFRGNGNTPSPIEAPEE